MYGIPGVSVCLSFEVGSACKKGLSASLCAHHFSGNLKKGRHRVSQERLVGQDIRKRRVSAMQLT